MANLLLPVASVFLAAPMFWAGAMARPESGSTPPLVFCVACATLTAVEALWPPASAAAQAVEPVLVPLL